MGNTSNYCIRFFSLIIIIFTVVQPTQSIQNITRIRREIINGQRVEIIQHYCNKWGYWNDDCDTVCSSGCLPVTDSYNKLKKKFKNLTVIEYKNEIYGKRMCDPESGFCLQHEGIICEINWRNQDEYHRCDIPMCFGQNHCHYGGICVEPNYCICDKIGDPNIVGIKGQYNHIGPNNEKTVVFDGIQCVSLRARGVKGALLATIVMMVSVFSCGYIADKKAKWTAQRLDLEDE